MTTDRAPTAEDIGRVRAGLMAFNEAQVGSAHVERFAIYLRDGNDAIVGGVVGFLAWQWMSVEWLWVSDALREQGHGSALLGEAEALARAEGCTDAKLDTYEFQAKPFYEKHGYSIFGMLDGYPANTRTYYMRKSLRP